MSRGEKPRPFDRTKKPLEDDGSAPPIDDLPLFSSSGSEPPETRSTHDVSDRPAPESPLERAPALPIEGPATLTSRLGSALLDLAAMAAAAVALLAGAALLGTNPTPGDWPAFVLPWVAFSFVYYVMPLAFWGRTPGMASLGLTARHLDGHGLSFGQAVRRWLASLLTTALLGLPGLLALTGRSASDLASGSITIWRGFRPSGS